MQCQKCLSTRIASVSAKCSDCFFAEIDNNEHDGYVLDDIGIGGGEYVNFKHCLDCGQIQGIWPLPTSTLEKGISDEEVLKFFENYFREGEPHVNLKSYNDSIGDANNLSINFGQ